MTGCPPSCAARSSPGATTSPKPPAAGGLGLAPATIDSHLASLSGFTTWVCAHEPAALPHGNACAKVGDMPPPALEPRALARPRSAP